MGRNIESVYAVGHGQGEGLDIRKDDDHFPRYAPNINALGLNRHTDFSERGRSFQEVEQVRNTEFPICAQTIGRT